MNRIVLLVILNAFLIADAFAHSGRTNSSGCHNDRKNGGYHCHNSKPKMVKPYSSSKNKSSTVNSDYVAKVNAESFRKLVKQTQIYLEKAGYKVGNIRGELDSITTKSIKQFQTRVFEEANGTPSHQLLNRLKVAVNEAS